MDQKFLSKSLYYTFKFGIYSNRYQISRSRPDTILNSNHLLVITVINSRRLLFSFSNRKRRKLKNDTRSDGNSNAASFVVTFNKDITIKYNRENKGCGGVAPAAQLCLKSDRDALFLKDCQPYAKPSPGGPDYSKCGHGPVRDKRTSEWRRIFNKELQKELGIVPVNYYIKGQRIQ
ncbi:hypothetical protein AGLY_000546 [Aphis glycines]|uniref:Uncharacterized protein n=1 Tax=Aphis glycines TaxID=307491 RepID=A0A6G0U7S6_APHGL|nr:hypothetical protein AGLY_000546 [Aphis glycines]